MNKKGFSTSLVALVVVVIVLIVGGIWYYEAYHSMISEPSGTPSATPIATSTGTHGIIPPQPLTLPTAYVGGAYSTNLGGATDTPETVTTSGQLPPGLSIDPVPLPCPMTPTGTAACGGFKLDGTPTKTGAYSFSVIFSTAGSQTTQAFDLMVMLVPQM